MEGIGDKTVGAVNAASPLFQSGNRVAVGGQGAPRGLRKSPMRPILSFIPEGERMEGHVSPGEYKDVILFLATAGVIVPLFRRWRISPILGFLGAGVVLGPFGLGALAATYGWLSYVTIDNPDELAQLAEFGVVFLLFMIGLELSWERLRLMRRWVFGLGAQ